MSEGAKCQVPILPVTCSSPPLAVPGQCVHVSLGASRFADTKRAPLTNILSARGPAVKLSVRRYQPMVETGAPPRSVMPQPESRYDAERRGVAGVGGGGTDINEQAPSLLPKQGTRDL
ncbi:hypothetical protein Q8A73_008171 [Channa argus]|nr:hypothetical protein Q8A73_008171 [Channa argus]